MSWTFSGQVAPGFKITTERIATTNQKFTTPSSGDPSVDGFMGIACCRPPRAHTQLGDERGREKIDKLSIQSSEHEKYMHMNMKNITCFKCVFIKSFFYFIWNFSRGSSSLEVWKVHENCLLFRNFGCFANKTTFTLFYLKELYFVYLFIIKYFVYDVLVLFFISWYSFQLCQCGCLLSSLLSLLH